MYKLNEIFYEDAEYSDRAKFCNENGYIIVEIDSDNSKRRFQIQETPKPTEEEIKAILRIRREPLLTAFDKYKTNVQYGIETETSKQHEINLLWYQDLKDLKESAFENVPERIAYYY